MASAPRVSLSSVTSASVPADADEMRHPSSSSRSWPKDDGVKVYPEQIICSAGANVEDYAQHLVNDWNCDYNRTCSQYRVLIYF